MTYEVKKILRIIDTYDIDVLGKYIRVETTDGSKYWLRSDYINNDECVIPPNDYIDRFCIDLETFSTIHNEQLCDGYIQIYPYWFNENNNYLKKRSS
jgi:hypothetical protein